MRDKVKLLQFWAWVLIYLGRAILAGRQWNLVWVDIETKTGRRKFIARRECGRMTLRDIEV